MTGLDFHSYVRNVDFIDGVVFSGNRIVFRLQTPEKKSL